jgi:DNA polymerase
MSTSRLPHYATHADLIAAMHALTDDPLAATGARICIWRGNPEADLMVIGEGPGKNEDEQGKPYVGRAGQLLDRILEAAGFDSQNGVYVTNTVFRRPPGNRDPLPAELAYYKPYLLEAIRLVNPKVILLTGRFSMRQILGDDTPTISRVRGQWFQRDSRWIMPIFHPAYLLRNPSREKGSPKALTWHDIQAVRAKYDEVGGRQELLLKSDPV